MSDNKVIDQKNLVVVHNNKKICYIYTEGLLNLFPSFLPLPELPISDAKTFWNLFSRLLDESQNSYSL